MVEFLKLVLQFLDNMFSGLFHVLEILQEGWQMFVSSWFQFIPGFLIPFVTLSTLITIVLVIMRRANK